jgi:hypothetical protein
LDDKKTFTAAQSGIVKILKDKKVCVSVALFCTPSGKFILKLVGRFKVDLNSAT